MELKQLKKIALLAIRWHVLDKQELAEALKAGGYSADSNNDNDSNNTVSHNSERRIGCCPECGSSNIEYEGGCSVCRSCGYSECG